MDAAVADGVEAVPEHRDPAMRNLFAVFEARASGHTDRPITDHALALTARATILGRPPCAPLSERDPRPGLYVPAGDGEWTFHGADYDSAAAHGWVVRECRRSMPRAAQTGGSLVYFATHWAYCQNEHLDVAEGRPPSADLVPNWAFVRGMLEVLDDADDCIVEKSRDMMASWLCMVAVLHDMLFRPRWATMTVSRVEKLVDDGGEASTIDSLHGKLRFMYLQLPAFLRLAFPLTFKHLQINNPLTGAHTTGFAATPNAGRGPKWKRAIMDEFSHQEQTEAVLTSVVRACPRGKCLNSTPNGTGNAFYRIRQGAKQHYPPLSDVETWKRMLAYCDANLSRDNPAGHWKRVTIHWTQHPLRDEDWYRGEIAKESLTQEAVAQELDISYERSVVGRVYPTFGYDLHVSGGAFCQTRTAYDPLRALVITMDFNHDPLIWEIIQRHAESPPYRVIGEICRRSAIYQDAVYEFACRYGSRAMIEGLTAKVPDFERIYGSGGVMLAGPGGHQAPLQIYGDATEEKKTVYNREKLYRLIVGQLRELGFSVTMEVPKTNPAIITRHEILNDALRREMVVMDPSCVQLRTDFERGVWKKGGDDMDQSKKDDDGSGLTRSHASSALGYFIARVHHVTSAQQAASRTRVQNVGALLDRWRGVQPGRLSDQMR